VVPEEVVELPAVAVAVAVTSVAVAVVATGMVAVPTVVVAVVDRHTTMQVYSRVSLTLKQLSPDMGW
jgi:hypothetical protein